MHLNNFEENQELNAFCQLLIVNCFPYCLLPSLLPLAFPIASCLLPLAYSQFPIPNSPL